MNKKIWIAIYLGALAVDLIAVYSNFDTVRYVTKPLLMPLLVGYFITNTITTVSPLKKWIILALALSWAGDVLLMFEPYDEFFFISGLIAFLLAHVCYIIFFNRITKFHGVHTKFVVAVIGIIYYFGFMYVLKPSSLGSLEWPVRIYGAVLLSMFIVALHMAYIRKPAFALLTIAGASLFVISDSLLAINKFYKQFENAGIAIMSTYAIAQLLLIIGAAKYITSISKQ